MIINCMEINKIFSVLVLLAAAWRQLFLCLPEAWTSLVVLSWIHWKSLFCKVKPCNFFRCVMLCIL